MKSGPNFNNLPIAFFFPSQVQKKPDWVENRPIRQHWPEKERICFEWLSKGQHCFYRNCKNWTCMQWRFILMLVFQPSFLLDTCNIAKIPMKFLHYTDIIIRPGRVRWDGHLRWKLWDLSRRCCSWRQSKKLFFLLWVKNWTQPAAVSLGMEKTNYRYLFCYWSFIFHNTVCLFCVLMKHLIL